MTHAFTNIEIKTSSPLLEGKLSFKVVSSPSPIPSQLFLYCILYLPYTFYYDIDSFLFLLLSLQCLDGEEASFSLEECDGDSEPDNGQIKCFLPTCVVLLSKFPYISTMKATLSR